MTPRAPRNATVGLPTAAILLAACAPTPQPGSPEERPEPAPDWAIAIHGGAGGLPETERGGEREAAYGEALEHALRAGAESLEEGASSLDVVEQVLRILEDDELFNAGRGAVYTHEGTHELDAAVMRGSDLATGAVAGVRNVKNPVSLARLVMEKTDHVLLISEGAEAFAAQQGVELVDQEYFHTERRWEALQRAIAAREELDPREATPESAGDEEHGTVGAVALDRRGHLAAATSTGGRTNKMWGRVGDVPIVGAGTYANDGTCAVSGTGKGEEFIRHAVASSISKLMEYRGLSLAEAARQVIHETLEEGDGGVVAVGADGEIAMEFNTAAMFRGAATSAGRFEVAIWPK